MLTIETLKENWKRYAFSSLITFLAGFLIVIYPEIDNLTYYDFNAGALTGIVFLAVRGGVKVLIEYLLTIISDR